VGAEQPKRPRLAVLTDTERQRGQVHRLGHIERGHDRDEGIVAHEVQPDPPGPIDPHPARQRAKRVGQCFGAVLEVGRLLTGRWLTVSWMGGWLCRPPWVDISACLSDGP
jgi:hypothetical protein